MTRDISESVQYTLSVSQQSTALPQAALNKNVSPFPPELWIEILSFLPASSASAVTLSCKYLACVAQPFVYQRVSFRPSIHQGTATEYTKRLDNRLAFFTSPGIVHYVQECSIALRKRPRANSNITNPALETIFDAIPAFPNLSKLVFNFLKLTPRHLFILRTISPPILDLTSCVVDPDWNSPVPVKSLICSDDFTSDPFNAVSAMENISLFLDPTHIQHITVGKSTAEILLSALAASDIQFNSLTHLEVPVDAMASDVIVQALSNCSNVKSLILRYNHKCPDQVLRTLPPDVLPNLTSFHGPHQYAFLFAHDRPLSAVTVRPPDKFSIFHDPAPLYKTLISLGSHLRSLDIMAVTDLASVLTIVRSSFPALTSLAINAHPELYARSLVPADIVSKICGHGLPVGLERLQLGVQLGGDRVNILEGALAVCDAARGASPALVEVRMWYWAFSRPNWVTCRCSAGLLMERPRVDICSEDLGGEREWPMIPRGW